MGKQLESYIGGALKVNERIKCHFFKNRIMVYYCKQTVILHGNMNRMALLYSFHAPCHLLNILYQSLMFISIYWRVIIHNLGIPIYIFYGSNRERIRLKGQAIFNIRDFCESFLPEKPCPPIHFLYEIQNTPKRFCFQNASRLWFSSRKYAVRQGL